MNEHSIGYLVHHYRTLKAFSRIEFAKEVGVSPQTVFYWETNQRKITMPHIRRIAEVLGVDVTEFTQYLLTEER